MNPKSVQDLGFTSRWEAFFCSRFFALFGEFGGEGFSGLVDFLERSGALEEVKEVAVLHAEGLDIAIRGKDLGEDLPVLRLEGVAADPDVAFLLGLKFAGLVEPIVKDGGGEAGIGELLVVPGIEDLVVEV